LPDWIGTRTPNQPIGPQILAAALGDGESEALALALELKAGLTLLDDLAARRMAATLHLPLIGTLGILLRAKDRGLIPAVRPRLESPRSLPFHISNRLYDLVLASAGE